MNPVDGLLDRTLLLGYSSPGLALRRRLPSWPADPPRMDGKVVLVTGAGAGLGYAAAEGYARLGAGVRVLVRRADQGNRVSKEIQAATGADVRPVVCDVSELASVREFAQAFIAQEPRLDVLVHNAGVMPPQRTLTSDGIELTLATHVVGPFALTALLGDLLRDSAPARIINVSSGGMYSRRLAIDDLQAEHCDYSPPIIYARTKRAQVIMAELWAQRLAGSGVVSHSMHPGWADTPGVREALPTFQKVIGPIIRDARQGADTIVWLGAAPEPAQSSGLFWHDRRPRTTHYTRFTRETEGDRARLWAQVAELSGLGALVQ